MFVCGMTSGFRRVKGCVLPLYSRIAFLRCGCLNLLILILFHGMMQLSLATLMPIQLRLSFISLSRRWPYDKLFWSFTKNGLFYVKSGYWLALYGHNDDDVFPDDVAMTKL